MHNAPDLPSFKHLRLLLLQLLPTPPTKALLPLLVRCAIPTLEKSVHMLYWPINSLALPSARRKTNALLLYRRTCGHMCPCPWFFHSHAGIRTWTAVGTGVANSRSPCQKRPICRWGLYCLQYTRLPSFLKAAFFLYF